LTLPELSPAEIVRNCKEAGLTHIEWWGRGHVPMGDVETAATVGRITREAGLQVSTYGSYYRVGVSQGDGLAFDDVLQTGLALEAPAIRVWAGTQGSGECSDEQRQSILDETLRIADHCSEAGVRLVFEYHGGTLTATNASAEAFAAAAQHPSVFFGWQCRTGVSATERMAGLRVMLPRLATLHVFNWSKDEAGNYSRHPLGEAVEEWRGYFDVVAATGHDHVALLEFVKDNSVEQFQEDARVLREMLSTMA